MLAKSEMTILFPEYPVSYHREMIYFQTNGAIALGDTI
jgi:hypothetical protein